MLCSSVYVIYGNDFAEYSFYNRTAFDGGWYTRTVGRLDGPDVRYVCVCVCVCVCVGVGVWTLCGE